MAERKDAGSVRNAPLQESAVSSAATTEREEELVGFLWDATKHPSSPLWWCLRDDLKDAFRETIFTEIDGRLARQRAVAYEEAPDA